MVILLLGAPGAGKGTQAKILTEKYNLAHLSTGDLFRYHIKNETEIGKVAKGYMDAGKLVPDEVTCAIVKESLPLYQDKKGIILDGFPRNLAQAENLEGFCKLDCVLNIEVAESLLLDRICGRRVCKECGASHHINHLQGKTTCQYCNGTLYQRPDDSVETAKERFSVYNAQTKPLIEFYKAKGILYTIDGNKEQNDVLAAIEKVIDAMAK